MFPKADCRNDPSSPWRLLVREPKMALQEMIPSIDFVILRQFEKGLRPMKISVPRNDTRISSINSLLIRLHFLTCIGLRSWHSCSNRQRKSNHTSSHCLERYVTSYTLHCSSRQTVHLHHPKKRARGLGNPAFSTQSNRSLRFYMPPCFVVIVKSVPSSTSACLLVSQYRVSDSIV